MTSSDPPFEQFTTRVDASAAPRPLSTPARPPIRVVLADDHTLLREGLKLILNLRAGVLVVDETDRLSAIPELLAQRGCDVLVLGLGLGTHGLADVTRLSEMAHILVVCDGERIEDAVAIMRAGARGAIFRRSTGDTLIDAIIAVASGQTWMPPEMQSRLAESMRDDPRRRLTLREREVVRHVALGLRNAEVGGRLLITEQTVKTHLSHIFRKTGARDRVELALYAARFGIITLSERLA